MIFTSLRMLAASTLHFDAFKRARCPDPKCRAARLVLGPDGRHVLCEACGFSTDEKRLANLARVCHCSQCRRFAGLWGGAGLPRCWGCHVDWIERGRPEQQSRGISRVRDAVPVAKLLRLERSPTFASDLARYQRAIHAN